MIPRVILLLLCLFISFRVFSHPVDGIEHIFGATNINGISGNGGLTIGISRDGDLTLLKYPSPSFYDQLNYRTSTAQDARTLPFFGAQQTMGAFSGLIIHTSTGEVLSWLRDPVWNKVQHYNTDDSSILVTEYNRDDYKILVKQYDFVLPDKDAYIRHHEIELLPGSTVEAVDLVFYENLAPCNKKEPFLPTADWGDDSLNDFALVYYAPDDVFIHYRPDILDYSRIKSLMDRTVLQTDVDLFVEDLAAGSEAGIYAVIGGMGPSIGHQAGIDTRTSCPVSEIMDLPYKPEDAYDDIQDLTPSGSSVGLCQANGVMVFKVEFNQLSRGENTVVIAMGNNLTDAMNTFRAVRASTSGALLYNTESFWNRRLNKINLPDSGDSDVIAFSKRTLLSIMSSTDRNSGAIVASVSVQPPYGEDWTRDGAFINLALDVAGLRDVATKHNYFYSKVQRKTDGQDTFGMFPEAPAGSFAMNYYSDGMPGGPIDFEIDETGLALWTLVTHAKFLKNDSERCDYFGMVYPAIKLAAQALTECKDETTGLQCYAYEDDNYSLTQGLQGAVTVYLGLMSAVEAGNALQEDPALVDKWTQRANELKQAIFTHLLNHETNSFEGREIGSRAWLLWPARILEPGDPVGENEAEALYNILLPHLQKKTEGAAYLGKITLALAQYWKDRKERFNDLEQVILPLLKDVPIQGTRHVGEVFVTLDRLPEGSPDGINDTFDARVAVPHIWEASLNYLSAMALYSPDTFAPLEKGFSKLPCPVKGGCGCNSMIYFNSLEGGLLVILFLIAGVFMLKWGIRRGEL